MSRGFPSMTALLGLLAVAGFQNRDKIAEMLGGALGPGAGGAGTQPGGMSGQIGGNTQPGGSLQGGLSSSQGGLGGLLGGIGSGGVGGFLGSGLGELVEQFTRSGHGDIAESWVGHGPNKDVAPQQLEQTIGPDVLDTLTRQTGLSREEILARLSKELPRAVDQYTPDGRLPS